MSNGTRINVEETPGKAVGRMPSGPASHDALVEASYRLMDRLPVPKGVYRFESHDAANAWLEKHILEAALAKARARRNERT